jgi:hypothetical protein
VPGATDRRSPVPGLRRWLPGLLAALGVGCTLAAVAIGALVEDARPVDAGDATLGVLYPLVAALVLSRFVPGPAGPRRWPAAPGCGAARW